MAGQQQKILAATLKLLRPLVRTLLRLGVSHSEFSELARKAFVDAAFDDFQLDGKKQTVSRVATLTGLSRKEVLRLKLERELPPTKEPRPVNRAARVVNGWLTDPQFRDYLERAMPMYGGDTCFAVLVKKYSGDVPPGTIADELVRTGVAQREGDFIELAAAGYVPVVGTDQKISIMGDSARDLLTVLDHNLAATERSEARLQRSVVYHNMPDHLAREFRALSEQKATALLAELNEWLATRKRGLSRYDYGANRIGLGIYQIESVETSEETIKRDEP